MKRSVQPDETVEMLLASEKEPMVMMERNGKKRGLREWSININISTQDNKRDIYL